MPFAKTAIKNQILTDRWVSKPPAALGAFAAACHQGGWELVRKMWGKSVVMLYFLGKCSIILGSI